MNAPDRPNILMIVLDTGRFNDFPGGSNPISGLPFLESLWPEVLSFPRTVAPATWTVPSHAAFFTGRYPWETGAHLRRSLKLDPSFPTLAGLLGQAGYASFTASANGFLCPDFGLTNGFTSAAWGDWWEKWVHVPNRTLPPAGFNCGPTEDLPTGTLWKRLEAVGRIADRSNAFLMGLNRFVNHLRNPGHPFSPYVGPWVESTLQRWLKAQRPEQPIFTFLNFYEAHEPYIVEWDQIGTKPPFFERMRLRQDRTSFFAGQWKPRPEEYDLLREMSHALIRAVDARIKAVVDLFKEAGRWENTVLVFTSDHGQSFGENDFLFHGVRVWESILRVPLWIRFPSGEHRGQTAQGWASLIDLFPTLLGIAGAPVPYLADAIPLLDLLDRPRPIPVLSMSDGTTSKRTLIALSTRERAEFWDKPFVAAYEGDDKVIYDVETGSYQIFNVREDPLEEHDLAAQRGPELGTLVDRARQAGAQLIGKARLELTPELDDRLRSWGYE
jgi:arylsulfatase A-like enzyme